MVPSVEVPRFASGGVRSNRRRAVLAAFGAVALGLLVLGPVRPALAAPAAVDVQDNQFVAASVTVTVGDTVTWTESGNAPHSVTADDGSFDSGPTCLPNCLSHGASFAHTFTQAGTFAYHCKIHGAAGGLGMSGVVHVEAAPGSTTTAVPTSTTSSTATTAPRSTTTPIPTSTTAAPTSTSSTTAATPPPAAAASPIVADPFFTG